MYIFMASVLRTQVILTYETLTQNCFSWLRSNNHEGFFGWDHLINSILHQSYIHLHFYYNFPFQ